MRRGMPLDLIVLDPGRPCFRPYQRYSSGKQRLGESLARQEGDGATSNKALAARFGLPLGKPMVDRASSGYRGDNLLRGTLGAYVKKVSDGLIPKGEIIGLDEWSRLTRLPLDVSSHLLTSIITAGVGIYVRKNDTLITRDSVNGATGAMDLAMALMFLKLGHEESSTKARYTRNTKRLRHEQAERDGTIASGNVPGWLKVSGGTYKEALAAGVKRGWIILDGPKYVIDRIFPEALIYGAETIAMRLNRDWLAGDERCAPFGLHRRGSTGWYAGSISALLRDRRLLGEVRYTARETETGKAIEDRVYSHRPVMLEPALFDKVQQAIASRRAVKRDQLGRIAGKGGRKGHAMPNLFWGFVHCECGSPVTFYTKRPGKTDGRKERKKLVYNYLQCRSARNGMGCKLAATAYEPVERGILDALADLPVTAFEEPNTAGPLREAENEVARLSARLDMITRQTDRFAEIEDEDEQEAMRPKLKAWGRERREISAKIGELAATIDRLRRDEGSEERLMTVKRLRAKALTSDGPERIEARKVINTALATVLQGIMCSGRFVTAYLRFGQGHIIVNDGKLMPVLTNPALQRIARENLLRHNPDVAPADIDAVAKAAPKFELPHKAA